MLTETSSRGCELKITDPLARAMLLPALYKASVSTGAKPWQVAVVFCMLQLSVLFCLSVACNFAVSRTLDQLQHGWAQCLMSTAQFASVLAAFVASCHPRAERCHHLACVLVSSRLSLCLHVADVIDFEDESCLTGAHHKLLEAALAHLLA